MAVNLWRQSLKDSAVGPIRPSLGQRPRNPVSTSFQGLKARSIGRDLETSPDRSRLPVAPRLSGPESGALSTLSHSWGLRPEGGRPGWRRCRRSGQCRNRRRSLRGSPGSAVPGDRGRRPAEPSLPLASTCGKSMDWLARGWGTWACRKFRGEKVLFVAWILRWSLEGPSARGHQRPVRESLSFSSHKSDSQFRKGSLNF